MGGTSPTGAAPPPRAKSWVLPREGLTRVTPHRHFAVASSMAGGATPLDAQRTTPPGRVGSLRRGPARLPRLLLTERRSPSGLSPRATPAQWADRRRSTFSAGRLARDSPSLALTAANTRS